jgi:hypothetical protein
LAPFEVEVGNGELVVELAEPGVEDLILVVLPVGAGGVAEEEAAAEGADGVDGAEFVYLEGATLAGPFWIGLCLQVVNEGGQFEGGDIEAVAEFLEAAAAAADDAFGPAEINLVLQIHVELMDGNADVVAR